MRELIQPDIMKATLAAVSEHILELADTITNYIRIYVLIKPMVDESGGEMSITRDELRRM
jgi:hypothetical protein